VARKQRAELDVRGTARMTEASERGREMAAGFRHVREVHRN
jgi:hypothetical protein